MRVLQSPLRRPAQQHARGCAITAYQGDDDWLNGDAKGPLSGDSLNVLFKYGPIVYGNRCFQAEEYDASVRKLMDCYPQISRQLAEQEIHEFMTDTTGYMARTTDAKYKGPKEEDLKTPVGLMDKVLVIAWVIILVPAIKFIVTLCLNLSLIHISEPTRPY